MGCIPSLRPAVFGRMVVRNGAGCHLVGTSGRRTRNSAESGTAGGITRALSIDVRLTNRAGACSWFSDRRRTWNVSLPAWSGLLNVASLFRFLAPEPYSCSVRECGLHSHARGRREARGDRMAAVGVRADAAIGQRHVRF